MKNGSRTVGIAATATGRATRRQGTDSKNVAYTYQTVAQLHFGVCIGLSSCQLFSEH